MVCTTMCLLANGNCVAPFVFHGEILRGYYLHAHPWPVLRATAPFRTRTSHGCETEMVVKNPSRMVGTGEATTYFWLFGAPNFQTCKHL